MPPIAGASPLPFRGCVGFVALIPVDIHLDKAYATAAMPDSCGGHDHDILLEEILGHSLAGHWDWDMRSGRVFLSPALKAMLGWEAPDDETVFDACQAKIYEQDLPGVLEASRAHRESGGAVPFHCEFRYLRGEGAVAWLMCSGRVVAWDAQGQPVRMIGSVCDITDRKRIEQTLTESEALLNEVGSMAAIGGGEFDVDTGEVRWTRELFRIHDLPEGTPIDVAAALRFFDPPERVTLEAAMERCATLGEPYDLELPFTSATGRRLWTRVMAHAVREEGRIVKVRGSFQDITAMKALRDAVATKQKMEALGQLAAGIAHDFNNLLGSVFGFVDLAANSTGDQAVASYLASALDTIDRARGLTGQLLTFAKGGAPVRKIQTLAPCVEKAAKFALSGSHVAWRCHAPRDLWLCEFDATQVGQAIDNIVRNAMQAMPHGGAVEIAMENASVLDGNRTNLAPGNYVKITVRDQGVGMTRAVLQRAFDPFFSTKAAGQGLGLAIAYSIVSHHGGCMEAESEPGQGSVFRIFIPAAVADAAVEDDRSPEIHQGTGLFLVMDDEKSLRKALQLTLELFGYEVALAEHGDEALACVARERDRITGMLFDLTVPGGLGAKEIIGKVRETGAKAPVLVMSGYSDDPVLSDPQRYGFTASICKPFTLSELAALLNAHL
jgi:PAS domain S-box-containing protein